MGVIGPKGLSSEVTKKLEDAFTKAVKEPSFIRVMEKIQTGIAYMSSEEMGKYIKKTYKEQKELIDRIKGGEPKK